eukprot:CAMPEP_0172717850 /NCGR_PEP_ID=MMETSP1074-20121228/72741_1 /TAXON_ID=2916 /ORGANISM="Ceratium fusus, Strain PA161109" /LENGTH=154 /DNA_ID=CAMNT_0013542891 /DNA_START=314 /DNA_END=776 /DNA_ORIENTATION=-
MPCKGRFVKVCCVVWSQHVLDTVMQLLTQIAKTSPGRPCEFCAVIGGGRYLDCLIDNTAEGCTYIVPGVSILLFVAVNLNLECGFRFSVCAAITKSPQVLLWLLTAARAFTSSWTALLGLLPLVRDGVQLALQLLRDGTCFLWRAAAARAPANR